MNEQATNVLRILQRDTEATCDAIARELDCPSASVRRSISRLIKDGYRILRPGNGCQDVYRLL